MATIHLGASYQGELTKLGAILGEREWPGGGKTPILRLFIGQDEVQIWPADPERLDELGTKLKALADVLRKDWEPHCKKRDDELPTLGQLRGAFSGCTEGKTAVEFVRAIRDGQDPRERDES